MNLKKNFYYIILIIFFTYVAIIFYKNWNYITSYEWQFHPVDLILVIIFLIPIYFINVLAWHYILLSLNQNINYKDNLRIWTFSNLARFIPGSVFQYPSRVLFLQKYNIPKKVSVVALFLEFALNIGVGIFVIALFSLFTRPSNNLDYAIQMSSLIVLLGIFCWLILLNNLSKQIIKLLNRFGIDLPQISIKYLVYACILFFILFILGGISLLFVTRNITPVELNSIFEFIKIYALSWLIGYLVVLAPGGLGVQEITMSTLLGKIIPVPVALIIVIVFRIVLYISELIALSVGLYLNRKK